MKRHLFLCTTSIVFTGLICFFIATVLITRNNNFNIAKNSVIEITQICAGLYNDDADVASFVRVGNDTRITIIAPDGTVLADSRPLDFNSVENHLERPEIQAALNDNPATYVRYSDTLGINSIYYALKANSGDSYVFIRTAVPVAKINAYLFQSLSLLIIILIFVVIICFAFIRSIINQITKPFNSVEQRLRLLTKGEYVSGSISDSYEEIDKIIREIDDIALILQKGINDLSDEKDKLDYIIGNISDGIFAVDENKDLTLINNAALDIFGVTQEIKNNNVNYLSFDKNLLEAIDDSVNNGKNSLLELMQDGSIYLTTIKKLPDKALTMVILSDITQTRENAKRREEFFTNASHELKTPLTAIKGFNELMSLNNKDDNLDKFISGITRETERILSLIEDMLKLSELENTQSINPVAVPLIKVIDDVRETLSPVISEKELTFEVKSDGDIDNITVNAEYSHIYEVVKNLAENAVRYNNRGGRVSVIIEDYKKSIKLFVFDGGIGISPEEQTRIFERFYRVEKSRSQRNGGTGLGLSIVKHICTLYDWKLSLKSKFGVGTEVSVEF
ncbi:MAG: ATP-binding protein [Oscillospiraceae bacterium]|nr:ATP-binding protein [Oscillospiraceae bacterium]